MTDSLTVAENFRKQHKYVLRKIEKLVKEDTKDRLIFAPILYKDSYGREQKKFDMDRKTFSILSMGFSGKKAMEWKIKFYDAFEKMDNGIGNSKIFKLPEN